MIYSAVQYELCRERFHGRAGIVGRRGYPGVPEFRETRRIHRQLAGEYE